jgi:hypothetical protein
MPPQSGIGQPGDPSPSTSGSQSPSRVTFPHFSHVMGTSRMLITSATAFPSRASAAAAPPEAAASGAASSSCWQPYLRGRAHLVEVNQDLHAAQQHERVLNDVPREPQPAALLVDQDRVAAPGVLAADLAFEGGRLDADSRRSGDQSRLCDVSLK